MVRKMEASTHTIKLSSICGSREVKPTAQLAAEVKPSVSRPIRLLVRLDTAESRLDSASGGRELARPARADCSLSPREVTVS